MTKKDPLNLRPAEEVIEDEDFTVPADDRRPGEFPTDPQAGGWPTAGKRFRAVRDGHTTVAALEALWAARDAQYATLEHALTDRQIGAIREFRILEVRDLSPQEQVGTDLATRALTWMPPR